MALTKEEIGKLNWHIADVIRAKGNGNNNDAMSVAIPLIILKRLLDMRKEYKEQFNSPVFKEQYNIMQLYGDIDQAIANYQDNASEFAVKADKLHLYRIQWSDILNFPDNYDTTTFLNYTDSLVGEKSFQATATDKVLFIEEIIDSFKEPKISEIFNYFDFKTKINSSNISQILSYEDFVKLLKEMDKYEFSLTNASSDVFSDAYMDLLKRFAPQKGSKQGEFFTPNPIVKALIQMINPTFNEEGITVIGDGSSGTATFMTEAAEHMIEQERIKLGKERLEPQERKAILEKLQIVVQEKERVSFAAGEANLLLHGLLHRTQAYHGNTIDEFSEKIGQWLNKINYMFVNPPYGLDDYGQDFASDMKKEGKELERWGWGVPNASDGDYAFMQSFLALISNSSTRSCIGAVLPLGTLFRDSTLSQRKIFIEEKDWVEGIVMLPGKLFNTTDIPVCFWILNKNKDPKQKGKIFFINAEHDFIKAKNKNDLIIENMVKIYRNRADYLEKGIEGYAKWVDLDVIKNNNFDLSVSKYVKKVKEKEIIDINKTLNSIATLKRELEKESENLSMIFNQIQKIFSNNMSDSEE